MDFVALTQTYPHCQFVARVLGDLPSKRCLLTVATLGGPTYFFEVGRSSIDEAAVVADEVIALLENRLSGETEQETESRLDSIREHFEEE